MAGIETGNNTPGMANVDSDYRLAVNLPTNKAQAGYTGLIGMADDAGAIRIPVGASSQGLIGSGQVQVDFEQNFAMTTLSPSIWQSVVTTMTTAVSQNALVLNSGNSVASAAVARLVSYRQAKTPRGSDRIIAWRAMLPTLVTGAITELGAFIASGTTSPTSGAFFRYGADGTLRGVSVSVSGAESTTSAMATPALNVAHDYVIWVTRAAIVFQIDDVVVGTIALGDTAPSSVAGESAPYAARCYNTATTATAQQVQIHRCIGALYGGTYGYSKQFLAALNGDVGTQGVTGVTGSYLANWANSAAPASATLSNTAAGYTTLGGQYQFAAVAGAETDYALFAYQVPAASATNQGKTLIVSGITIDTYNTGAASATTATLLQWGVAYDGSAVSLATTDASAAKAPRRVAIGVQSIPTGTAIGGAVPQVRVTFEQPLPTNAGNFFHIILKMPIGSATASQIIRGTVGIDATWE